MKGKVKFFNEMKGFGFVAADDGQEYFVHQSGLKPGVTLHENDTVTFDVEEGDRGLKAVNVSLDDGAAEEAPAEEEQSAEEEQPAEEEPAEEEPKEE